MEAEAEAAYASIEVKNMSEAERDDLKKLNSELLSWQQTPDTGEALASIPKLSISDIDPMPELIPTEEREINGVRLLSHRLQSHGIVYVNALFPLTDLSLDELPAASLLTELYKELPTENYNVIDLQNELRMHVGSMTFGLDVLAPDNDAKVCTPCLSAKAAVLENELLHAEELMTEILTRTKFDDKSLVRELIAQIEEDSRRSSIMSGNRFALCEARAHWSARDAAAEAVNGFTFLQYMNKMSKASDEELEGFAEFAAATVGKCVNSSNLILSVTSTDYADLTGFINMLPEGDSLPAAAGYKTSLPERMGIAVPAAVSFSALAYDMAESGRKMSGSMKVAGNIISLAYLWNEIRVQGGSYGASMSAGRTGSLFCTTFRDPGPARSLEVYKGNHEFLSEFAETGGADADLEGYIISTVAQNEPLLSPDAKGRAADDFVLSGFSDEDRIRLKREILDTTAADLASQCDVLADMADKGCVCVVGPRSALEACGDLEIFDLK